LENFEEGMRNCREKDTLKKLLKKIKKNC